MQTAGICTLHGVTWGFTTATQTQTFVVIVLRLPIPPRLHIYSSSKYYFSSQKGISSPKSIDPFSHITNQYPPLHTIYAGIVLLNFLHISFPPNSSSKYYLCIYCYITFPHIHFPSTFLYNIIMQLSHNPLLHFL